MNVAQEIPSNNVIDFLSSTRYWQHDQSMLLAYGRLSLSVDYASFREKSIALLTRMSSCSDYDIPLTQKDIEYLIKHYQRKGFSLPYEAACYIASGEWAAPLAA